MSCLVCFVAIGAHHAKITKRFKRFGDFAFTQKHRLAGIAPGLQVVRVVAVLHKAHHAVFRVDNVAAHNRAHLAAVGIAIDGVIFGGRHRRITLR